MAGPVGAAVQRGPEGTGLQGPVPTRSAADFGAGIFAGQGKVNSTTFVGPNLPDQYQLITSYWAPKINSTTDFIKDQANLISNYWR
jgi:hypothetical protein